MAQEHKKNINSSKTAGHHAFNPINPSEYFAQTNQTPSINYSEYPFLYANNIVQKVNAEKAVYQLAKNRLTYVEHPDKKTAIDYYDFAINNLENKKQLSESILQTGKNITKNKNLSLEERQTLLNNYGNKLFNNGTMNQLVYDSYMIPQTARYALDASYFYDPIDKPSPQKNQRKISFADERGGKIVNSINDVANAEDYDRTSTVNSEGRQANRKAWGKNRAKFERQQDAMIQPHIQKLTDLYHQYVKSEQHFQLKKDTTSATKRDEAYRRYIDYREDNLPLGVDKAYLNSQLNVAYQNQHRELKEIPSQHGFEFDNPNYYGINYEKPSYSNNLAGQKRPLNSDSTTKPTSSGKPKIRNNPDAQNTTETIKIPPRTVSRHRH